MNTLRSGWMKGTSETYFSSDPPKAGAVKNSRSGEQHMLRERNFIIYERT